MDRPSLLVVVRHGESERNQVKRGSVYFADDEARQNLKGIPDHKIPLTADGVRQAELTGIALRDKFGHFDYAYHSGYLRTIQTLNGILRGYPKAEKKLIKVRSNLFIRERDPGYAYDMTKTEAERFFPFLNEYWQTFGGFFAHPMGGESLAQVAERVYLFLNMLFRDRCGEKTLVVTHGGTIRSFRFLLEHWDYGQAEKWPPGQSPKNCGVTVYRYNKKQARLVLDQYNTVFW